MSLYYISHMLTGQKSAIKNNLILKNSDMMILKNAVLDDFGVIKKRPGSFKIGNDLTSSSILGLFDFAKNDGRHILLCGNGSKIYYIEFDYLLQEDGSFLLQENGNRIILDQASYTWTDTGVTGLTINSTTRFVNFVNKVFFVNGVQAVKDWDGGTTYDAQVASAPIANYITVFTDRIYTNDIAYPSRVHYTTIPDAGVIAWTGGDSGYYDVQTDDGDFITGLHTRRDRLLIFKNHYIEGRDSYFRRISMVRGLGTPANDTIVTINNKTYFFNLDDSTSTGIYEYGSSDPIKISNPIQDLIDDIVLNDPKTQFFATKQGMNYILHIGTTQGMNNVVVCYNTIHQAWSYWSYPSTISCFAPYNEDNIILPYYGTKEGRVYKMNGNQDEYYNGIENTEKNIILNIRTHPIHCSNPHLFKDFTEVHIFDENPIKSSIRYQIDRGRWKRAGVVKDRVSLLQILGKGYDIGIDILDSSLSSPEIKGLAIEYQTEEDTR